MGRTRILQGLLIAALLAVGLLLLRGAGADAEEPVPSPAPSGEVGPVPIPVAFAGWASWCAPTSAKCQSWGGDAKLGAVPSFRFGDEPYKVLVTHRGQEVLVTVVSFCACGDRHGIPTVIDLSPAAIAELTPTWRRDGIIRVHYETVPDQHPDDPPEHPDDRRMRVEDGGPVPTLPPTDWAP